MDPDILKAPRGSTFMDREGHLWKYEGFGTLRSMAGGSRHYWQGVWDVVGPLELVWTPPEEKV